MEDFIFGTLATDESRLKHLIKIHGGVTHNHMVVDVQAATLTDDKVDLLFRALADRTRRDIMRRTLHGEVSVSAPRAATRCPRRASRATTAVPAAAVPVPDDGAVR